MSPDQRTQQHPPRTLLVGQVRTICQLRSTDVDSLHVGYVSVSLSTPATERKCAVADSRVFRYSFPPVQPVRADNMNYVSAVYGVVTAILLGYWFARGKKTYRKREERRGSVVGVAAAGAVVEGQVVR